MTEWITGVHAVTAVLAAGRRRLRGLYASEPQKLLPSLAQHARERGLSVRHMSLPELERRSPSANTQGVALEAEGYPYIDSEALLASSPKFLLALDQIQDPHNFGALLRSAYALGVDGVLVAKDRSVHVTPTVVRASAGASELMRICCLAGLPHYLSTLKKQGFWILGADATGIPISECRVLSEPTVLVMGAEGGGMRQTTRTHCDQLLRIPIRPSPVVDSLNVSVAGGILLWELAKAKGCSTLTDSRQLD